MTSPIASVSRGPVLAACLILLVLATAAAVAQISPNGPIEVRELVLVNASGERRAALAVIDDYPVLQLFDADGTLRMTLGLAETGPALLVKDQTGRVRNVLSDEPSVKPAAPSR